MPRVVVIRNETDLESLTGKLLRSRVSEAQARSAAESLARLNPHIADVTKLAPGMVVLVPDSPTFNESASEPAAGGAVDDLHKLVRGGLVAAATRMKAANSERATERAEVVNAQKTAAVKKAMEADPHLKEQLEEAAKSAKAAQQDAAQAEKTMAGMVEGAESELAALAKLLGG
jgi:hypothetical protein